MALSPGSHLGAYEILALVGSGGMGEVYRARDTRLDRTVAIKILPPSIAADPHRRERFEREARTIAALSHPHICALYDISDAPNPDRSAGHAGTIRFLVLEYLEGRTLAKRLFEGAMPTADALRHAVAICGALDTAHRSGVVHRDLKPANVMLTSVGAKLLDFGLAKSAGPPAAPVTVSMPPNTPTNLTAEGTILGTIQYMAPEQIDGRAADARTDIFALGALLFEMLAGRAAFIGNTRGAIFSAILRDDPPPVSQLRPGVPSTLDRIVSTCLAKDPEDRYQSARDLQRELAWVAAGSHDHRDATAPMPSVRSSRRAWIVAAVVTIALIAAAAIAFRRSTGDSASTVPAQFTIAPPENTSFGGPAAGGTGYAAQIAISPDGRNIAFVAGTPAGYQIWLRPVASLSATPLAGTDGASFPFWSPDSRFIAFFAGGKLKKVAIAGGPPSVLCDAPLGRGGTWSRDDVIVASTSLASGLVRVPAAGGATTVVTTIDPATGETNHRWPHFLPDGRHFFYTASTGPCCPPSQPSLIRLASLDSSEPVVTLLQTESSVAYASGHIVFARDQTLMAQRFDPEARQLKGDAFPVAEHVATEQSRYTSASLSENGTLIYGQDSLQAPTRLTWFDRAGHVLERLGDAASYVSLSLSPDERRVAVAERTGATGNLDIWTIDAARGTRSRLTLDPDADQSPIWSPDGARLVFQRGRLGTLSLHALSIDEATAHDVVLESQSSVGGLAPSSWSADGRFIAYTLTTAFPLRADVWILPLFGDRKPFPLTQTTAFLETSATFSPDGRWIAYTTDEGGQPNISVQPFQRSGRKYPISIDGGSQPVWRADGKELFYLRADGTMMAVSTQTAGELTAGTPQALFPTGLVLNGLPLFNRGHVYAATKDGQRFLVNARLPEAAPLTVIVNWSASVPLVNLKNP